MTASIESGAKPKHEFLLLHVRYLGAHKQFVDDGASRSETLADLKPRVLEFFKLTETHGKTYTFYHDKIALPDLSVTVGTIAAGDGELKLKLVEQYEQG